MFKWLRVSARHRSDECTGMPMYPICNQAGRRLLTTYAEHHDAMLHMASSWENADYAHASDDDDENLYDLVVDDSDEAVDWSDRISALEAVYGEYRALGMGGRETKDDSDGDVHANVRMMVDGTASTAGMWRRLQAADDSVVGRIASSHTVTPQGVMSR